MEVTILSIGATLIKLGVLGGIGAGIITGITWFGKFNPKLKGKSGGDKHESDTIENLRKAVRQ